MSDFLSDPIGFLLIIACVFGLIWVIDLLFDKNSKTSGAKKAIVVIGWVVVILISNKYFAQKRSETASYSSYPCENTGDDFQDCLTEEALPAYDPANSYDETQALQPVPAIQSNHPAGTTGQCRDGSYTRSVYRQGACSYHGDIISWWG